jgi:hypothetical protein
VPAEDVWRPKEYSRWGDRRKHAWDAIGHAPDKYYYDFTPPGVMVKGGNDEWSRQEEEHLLVTYMVCPPLGNWGLFSMHVSGRCGRQCEQTFQRLQREGVVDRFLLAWAQRGMRVPASPSPGTQVAFNTPGAIGGKHKGSKRKRTSPDPTASLSKQLDAVATSPALETPNNLTLPNAEGITRRARSRLGGHMSPVKLLRLEDGDTAKLVLPVAGTLKGSNKAVSPLLARIRAMSDNNESVDASETNDKPKRQAKLSSGFATQARPLMPTIPQTGNLPLPETPCFSSDALGSKKRRRAAMPSSDGSFEQEAARLDHALEKRKGLLKDVCEGQLRRIQEQYSPEMDTSSLPRFSFTDGCKSLLMMRSGDQGAAGDEERIFEIPEATREQLERRSMYDLYEAEQEADRMHQVQLETLTALQQRGLSLS